LQIVPVVVHVILAFPAVNVGVIVYVRAVPSARAAPEVPAMTPAAVAVTAVIFLDV